MVSYVHPQLQKTRQRPSRKGVRSNDSIRKGADQKDEMCLEILSFLINYPNGILLSKLDPLMIIFISQNLLFPTTSTRLKSVYLLLF